MRIAPPLLPSLPMINVGQSAPPFDAIATTGEHVSLDKLRGKIIALYFFPKAFTRG